MKTSSNGRALIEEFEGCILGAYDDANDRIVQSGGSVRGTLTIGYGHTSAAGPPKVSVGQRITRDQADQILSSDLGKVETNVSNLVKVPINQNQFDALISFQFNTGALGRSSVLKKLNSKDYQGAADALLLYTKAMGKTLPGLVRRRKAERVLFLKPSVGVEHGGAGGAVVGTVAAAHQWPEYLPYIIIGGIILIPVVYFLIKYIKGK